MIMVPSMIPPGAGDVAPDLAGPILFQSYLALTFRRAGASSARRRSTSRR